MSWVIMFNFLCKNGFKYIARDTDGSFVADVYDKKPVAYKDRRGCKFYDGPDDATRILHLDMRAFEDITIKRGECWEINDLMIHLSMNYSRLNSDAVNHPKHYRLPSGRESIEVMKEILTAEEYRGWCKGNALKYIFREGKKDNDVQDIAKARKFLEFLMDGKIMDKLKKGEGK
nr:MAG TPA: nucelotide kinase [Caudoviricetes sp.]